MQKISQCKTIDASTAVAPVRMTLGGFMSFSIRAVAFVSMFALLSSARAGINVNNGNFYVAYTDFSLPTAGMNIEITRTYNSRSNYVKGYFGVGWSSEIEGYIVVEKKAIVYFEGGGGNIVRFEANKAGNLWTNGVYGNQSIRKLKASYVLQTSFAKELHFDQKGRLVKIADRNKNYIELVYSNDRPQLLKDNLNNQIKLTWKDFGKAPRITLIERGETKARYEYSAAGDLTLATGTDAIPYSYSYDDEHNMTKILYKDGTFKEMAYNKVRDWVTKFRDRDKMVTSYDYFADNLDPESKFGTVVSRFLEGSKEKDTSRFWYEFRRRADGTRYNYKSVSWIRKVVTETIYTECCSTPLVISQWKGEEPKKGASNESWTVATGPKRSTFFEYYTDGLLKKKTTPDGTVTLLTYDPKSQKVSSVAKAGRKVEYNYDDRGNLAWAFDSRENKRLDLTYDLKGRITVVLEQKQGTRLQKRTVFFRYDPSGKPVEIKEKNGDGKEGIIRIAYDRAGVVSGIFNASGRAIASENEMAAASRMASTFENLIEIVQPAGVTLTPEG